MASEGKWRPRESWIVLRPSPWHFVGVYGTEVEAQRQVMVMGPGYLARLGRHSGDDVFVFLASPDDFKAGWGRWKCQHP